MNRRRALAVAAAAALVLVITSVAVWAVLRARHPSTPAAAGTSAVPSVSSTASPAPSTGGPSGSPKASASPKVRQRCGVSSAVAVPPGGFALKELCDATLTVPAWPNRPDCPSGPVHFTNGSHFIRSSFFLSLGARNLASDADTAYADVDRDGRSETLLLLSCGGEQWISQVIALRRTAAGAAATLGQVVATGGAIKRLMTVSGNPDGTVGVEVADWNGGLGDDGSLAQRQWRTYRWDGHQFTQVAGPTSFPVNPRVTDLTVTASNLAFGSATQAGRTGTMSVTVRNLGPSTAPYLVQVTVPSYAQPSPLAYGCREETFASPVRLVTCTGEALRAGESNTLTLTFRAPANANSIRYELVPSTDVQVAKGYGDPNYANQYAYFKITFA